MPTGVGHVNTYDETIAGFTDPDLDPRVLKRESATTRSSETSYARNSGEDIVRFT
jgi:hypothetical protein